MRRTINRCSAWFLTAALVLTGLGCNAAAAPADNHADTVYEAGAGGNASPYQTYLEGQGLDAAEEDVIVPISRFSSESADAVFEDGLLIWKDGKGSLTFPVQIASGALYNMEIVWKPLKAGGVNPRFGLKIDGAYPFDGLENLELPREWKNATEAPRTDSQGNEYAQEQIETGEFVTTILSDNSGSLIGPLQFALAAGEHSITLTGPEQGLQIQEIRLTAPESCESYSSVSAHYDIQAVDAEIITLQGEQASRKSSKSMIPKSNNSDAGMTPSDAYKTKINYIGGTSWQTPGEKLTWSFDVKKSGYYSLHFRYKQSDLVNGDSWRWLQIDGETPFEEAKSVRFPYDTKWKYSAFSDEQNEPYYIWLDEGPHTISLEVTIAENAEYFERLSKVVQKLGDEYIKMVMITGESPDVNRDYELFNQIPGFTETLTACRDALDSLAEDMKAASGKRGTQSIASMQNMSRVLNAMLKSPYVAQQYISDYYRNYTSVSSWLYDMRKMPLALDDIQLVPAGQDPQNHNAGFFKKIAFSAMRLIASFTQDYAIADNSGSSGKSIRLWVNWGQDQAMVLNSLIKDSFTPKTGIPVQIEIVSASLINGILSGNFPDVSLHLSRSQPVNLGMRGALYDLTNFSDYDEVLSRFQKGAEEPYRYKEALYALPDTQSFFVLFYRTDILKNLGLSVPQTWDEFKHAAKVIQRNNMNVYVPYTQITSSTTVNAGIGSLNMFPTLMAQSGLSLYNAEKNATALVSKEAIGVFDFWTDLYTEYGFLKEADFYNRFRVGVVPLGIAPLSTYMTIYSAAPEIANRWSIALVPASSSGDRTVAGAGTGCGIIEKSSHKEEAWEFLKWWTSADTQSRYSHNVESILGMIGRTTTANVEAFNTLAWDAEHLEILNEQWENVEEVPEVPGSYYLSRAIDQAYWTVINGGSNAKDAIVKWSEIADDEIARKIREYS